MEKYNLSEDYSSDYIKAKLLVRFYYITLIALIFLKLTSLYFQSITFPFFITSLLIIIQYFIFKKYRKTSISSNLLVLTLFVPLVIETINTGGLYSDNLLYLLTVAPVSILLLNITQTVIWQILTLSFIIILYQLDQNNPGLYFKQANFESTYYFNAVFWLFTMIATFIITAGFVIKKINTKVREQNKLLADQQKRLILTNQKLHTSQVSLKKSNIALERLAAIASHDLKAPLRTMVSFTNLLDRQLKNINVNDERSNEFLSHIHSGGKKMTRLIDNLMNFATVKNINRNEVKPINVNQLIDDILIQLNASIEFPTTKILINLSPTILIGNPFRIRQLFQNVLSNALKFSAKNPEPLVKISKVFNQDNFQFSVEDNGIGIDKENQLKAFDLFTKFNADSDFMGSGIGLSTCKEVMLQHQGDIWFESREESGCKICFSFPANSVKEKVDAITIMNN